MPSSLPVRASRNLAVMTRPFNKTKDDSSGHVIAEFKGIQTNVF